VTLIDPKLKSPYSQNWNFGVQQAATPTLTLKVNYVGVKGNNLFRTVDGNPPQPTLVAQLLAAGVDTSSLQFGSLWNDGATNNNAFYSGNGIAAFSHKEQIN
jgi:hypothetical protein